MLRNVHKQKKSGLVLFKYKMVTQVKVKSNVKISEANYFLVKASVHATMKKTWYQVYAHLSQETAKVSLPSCLCKAYLGGCCKQYLYDLYYRPERPASFGGVEAVYRVVKNYGKFQISRNRIRECTTSF